jgi:hypothetical protein
MKHTRVPRVDFTSEKQEIGAARADRPTPRAIAVLAQVTVGWETRPLAI